MFGHKRRDYGNANVHLWSGIKSSHHPSSEKGIQSFPSLLTGEKDLNIRQVQLNKAWKHKGLSSKGCFSVRAGMYNVKGITELFWRKT